MNRTPLVLLALVCAASTTAAAPQDPAAIDKKIADALDRLGDQLDAIPNGGAANATAAAKATADQLDKLYRERGKDRDGTDTVADLEAALAGLDDLKREQDGPGALVPICTKAAAALEQALDDFAKRKDVKGVTALPDGAAKIAKTVAPRLADLAEARKLVDDAAKEVSDFRGAGAWSAIGQRLGKLGAESHRSFVDQHERAIKECTLLAKGKDHPRVVLVVKQLKDAQGQRLDSIEGLVAEYESYRTSVIALRPIYDQDVKLVLAESCKLDEKDRGAIDSAPVQAVLQKFAADLKKRIADLDREAAALDQAIAKLAPALAAGSDEAKQLGKVKAALTKTKTSLADAVKQSAFAQGSNHPWIRARMEQGKEMHARYQSGSCDASEITLGSMRIDCIQRCQIVEIKPDSASAISRGKTQVTNYHKAVVALWTTLKSKHKGDVAKATDDFGDTFPTLVAKKCIVNGELKLEPPVVETYKFCPKTAGELELGDPFTVDPAKL